MKFFMNINVVWVWVLNAFKSIEQNLLDLLCSHINMDLPLIVSY